MGNTASELQHVANQFQGVGPQEKQFIAALYGNKVEEAAHLLQEFPNLIYARTQKDWYGAWHLAAMAGDMQILEMLAKYGKAPRKPIPGEPAPINAKSKKGTTPLILACEAGRLEVAEFLLSHGANVRDQDTYGNTCVHYAAFHGHLSILEMLLARPDADGGGDNSRRFTDLRNEAGLMPLHFAVWSGKIDAGKILIHAKCRLNATSHSDSLGLVTCNAGSCPLHVAALKGNLEMAQWLLDTWAVMNAQPQRRKPVADPRTLRDRYKYTPYEIAQNMRRTTDGPLLKLLSPSTRISAARASGDYERIRSHRRSGDTSMRAPGAVEVSRDVAAPGSTPTPRSSLPGSSVSPAPAVPPALSMYSPNSSITRRSPSPEESPTGSSQRNHHPQRRSLNGGEIREGSPQPHAPAAPAALPAQPEESEEQRRQREEEEAAAAARAAEEAAAQAERERLQAEKDAQERAAAAAAAGLPPPAYVCAFTNNVMVDPVTASDERNYERAEIELWFEMGTNEFPGSGKPITSRELKPNDELRRQIQAWKESNNSQ